MKIINNELLHVNCLVIPEITGIYDPLSRRCDGHVTPQAPVVISGHHLCMRMLDNARFCLVSALEYVRVIELNPVYTYSDTRIIISVPALDAGEYFPAVIIPEPDGDDSLYVFPVSLVVDAYPYARMN